MTSRVSQGHNLRKGAPARKPGADMLSPSASYANVTRPVDETVSLSEVISALTFALDLTENALPGHSLRTCLLGMRLAEAIGLEEKELLSLYYALLLKDIGCADHVTRLSQITAVEPSTRWSLSDLPLDLGTNPLLLERVWKEVLPGVPLPAQIGRLAGVEARMSEGSTEAGIEEGLRGAETMRLLEMSASTIAAVAHINERWDGSGQPAGKRGTQIPLLARVCAVAQTLDAFAAEHGPETALRMLRARRGTWFDPELVRAAQGLHVSGRLWPQCQTRDVEATRTEVLRLDPGVASPLTPERMDRICEAFGNVVDAKSPFTYHHSLGVTEVAVALASELGLPPDRISLVRRAAFLHDIGKLAVPNHILDKRSKLEAHEWAVITRHPKISGSILSRVAAFHELASLAAEHHERLDGSGYPFGLRAEHLSLESRVIALSDCYAAMAENRPYRPGLDPKDILAELGKDVPGKFDGSCYAALQSQVSRWNGNMPQRLAAKVAGRGKAAQNQLLSIAS